MNLNLDFPPEVIDFAYDFEFETHEMDYDKEVADKEGMFLATGIFSIVLKPCFPHSPRVYLHEDYVTNKIYVAEDAEDLPSDNPTCYDVRSIRIPVEVNRDAYIKIRSNYIFNPYYITDYMRNEIPLRHDTFDYIRMRVFEMLQEVPIFHER
jgi:hypothetical protein